ncbi:MAG: NIPSNAP family containing protein [bacterium]|nr:NIPSNAP family containing protein [bacterium]
MERRSFIAASAAAAGAITAMAAEDAAPGQQYIEFRKYHTLLGDKKGILEKYLKDAAIPAYNRMGVGPVGVFSVRYGQTSPTLYVLLPHPSLESAVNSTSALLADAEFREAGKEFLMTGLSDPNYVRYESSLLRAFREMPAVEVPSEVKGKGSRIFELRTYESHSEVMAKKKIEMFNDGGEVPIFRKTGLHPVFFGETLFGTGMPNLTYMLAFESMEERDKNWGQFGSDPDWKKLSGDEQYKDTVSNISDVILRPAGCSQI